MEEKLLEELKKYSGFISIQTDIIDDVEITISSWKSKKDVEMWAKNPLHLKAKNKVEEWYYWVKGIHMETSDE